MNKKYPWLPIHEMLIPDVFSFKYPKSFWVRAALFTEILFATIAVIGTLVMLLLPRTGSFPKTSNAQNNDTVNSVNR